MAQSRQRPLKGLLPPELKIVGGAVFTDPSIAIKLSVNVMKTCNV